MRELDDFLVGDRAGVETRTVPTGKILERAGRPQAVLIAAADARGKLGLTRQMNDQELMEAAIAEARQGLSEGGIPIGSALARNGQLLAVGHNRRVENADPMTHAEIDCLRNAGRIGSFRDTVLYSTLMPCSLQRRGGAVWDSKGDRRRKRPFPGCAGVHRGAREWKWSTSICVRRDDAPVRRASGALERGYWWLGSSACPFDGTADYTGGSPSVGRIRCGTDRKRTERGREAFWPVIRDPRPVDTDRARAGLDPRQKENLAAKG